MTVDMLSRHFVAVVRHAERADELGATVDDADWALCDDFAEWPQDPPLSDAGVSSVQDIARRLRTQSPDDQDEASQENSFVIITSPYQRCYQTAAEISLSLGRAEISVDPELAELFGPSIMGPLEPENPVRPDSEIKEICKQMGVSCSFPFSESTMPQWPEDRRSAQRRFARCFMKHVKDAMSSGRNVILVSHSACVSSALSLMPSHYMYEIGKVDYGGFLVAKQVAHDDVHGHCEGLSHGECSLPTGTECATARLRCVLTQHVVLHRNASGSSATAFHQRVDRLLADERPLSDASPLLVRPERLSVSTSVDSHAVSLSSHDGSCVEASSRRTTLTHPPSPRLCGAEPGSDNNVMTKDAGCQLSPQVTESDCTNVIIKGGRHSLPCKASVTLSSKPTTSSLLLRRARKSI